MAEKKRAKSAPAQDPPRPLVYTADQRVVWARGAENGLLGGDYDDMRALTLPQLLHEGWEIVREVAAGDGAYFILGRK